MTDDEFAEFVVMRGRRPHQCGGEQRDEQGPEAFHGANPRPSTQVFTGDFDEASTRKGMLDDRSGVVQFSDSSLGQYLGGRRMGRVDVPGGDTRQLRNPAADILTVWIEFFALGLRIED